MTTPLPKQYDPQEAQSRWYPFWLERGYFHSEPNPQREPYTIVIPPPNVTGALHMGHALNNTLQDVLIRWRRMQGRETLWMPGSDHAGIATQAVVEKRLFEQGGRTRHDIGRDGLVRRIWAWKDEYEKRILRQLHALGCSCDWARTRFTLDEMCTRAVRHTFLDLFARGLIYRGKRLVNWDTALQTAVSDDEIFHETVQGFLWYFLYPVIDTDQTVPIATTRPETMLGDTAVAVHPDDPRYKHLIGKQVMLPLVQRPIPVIADAILVDPKFGTGCVKVTPAHDPNDYATGQRHGLRMVNILNPDGTINENGGPYAGLSRDEARRRVVEDLKTQGLLQKVEPYETQVGHSDRSKTPIEPYLSDQWFIRMEDLAQTAMDAVNDGRVRFHPPRYAKTYLDWLAEKRDWCISRQLWWGHRIPIWHCATCAEADLQRVFGTRNDVHWCADPQRGGWLVCALDDLAGDALGGDHTLEQDPDVLDTWFSSALWPHSTLGWPEPTPELQYYYPTSVLITSRDIITLWVARMVTMGLFNLDQVPFTDVYIHAKIQDAQGVTMSKSKGNGADPIHVVQKYGADALRFTLAQMSTEAQDFRLPVSYECPHCAHLIPQKPEHHQLKPEGGVKPRVACPACKRDFQPGSPNFDPDPGEPVGILVADRFELGRNFCNKLWNASRFALMNLDGHQPGELPDPMPLEDRWILSRLRATIDDVTAALGEYRFSDVVQRLYEFTWREFCDWYLEIVKPRLRDATARPVAQRVLALVLDRLLRLLHPVVPFVTEGIWQALADVAPQRGPDPVPDSVVIAPWPAAPATWHDPQAEQHLAVVQDVVHAIRNIRADFNIEQRARVPAHVRASADAADVLIAQTPCLCTLAGVAELQAGPDVERPTRSASQVLAGIEVFVSLEGLIDVPAETQRQQKKLKQLHADLQRCRAKLQNENFIERAPADVVQRQREREQQLLDQIQAVQRILTDLGS